VKLSRGVQRQVIEPLFSGYLFVDRIDEAKSLTPVRSTIGVKNIVKFGDSIQPVHEDIITMLQSRETDAGFHELERPTLKVGERVQIESGPLAGIEAVFQAERGSDRAMILIEVLGSSRTVQISKITLSDPDR